MLHYRSILQQGKTMNRTTFVGLALLATSLFSQNVSAEPTLVSAPSDQQEEAEVVYTYQPQQSAFERFVKNNWRTLLLAGGAVAATAIVGRALYVKRDAVSEKLDGAKSFFGGFFSNPFSPRKESDISLEEARKELDDAKEKLRKDKRELSEACDKAVSKHSKLLKLARRRGNKLKNGGFFGRARTKLTWT